MLSLIWLLLRPQKEGAFIGWAWTIAGILYVGWLLSYFVALRNVDPVNLEVGRNWVFFALFTTFGSDTTAFFVGRALGRHHLAPHISPGKTWEGAIGGVFGAIIVSLLFTLPTPLSLPLGYGQAILLGLVVSIFGQLGDLTESLLKRNMGVKDSGKLLPGHGGFLDRIDSVVFAGVVVYYYVIWAI
jgi:phosphatidate cytidylyltransferase